MELHNYIGSRKDRYGANYIPVLSYLFLCEINKTTLHHNCDANCARYKNTILHQYLKDKTSETSNLKIIKNDIFKRKRPWATTYIAEEIFKKTGKAFPDIFHNSKIYYEVRERYFSKYGKKSPTSDSIVIHVRLNDLRKPKKNAVQEFIGEDNLIDLINALFQKFKLNIFLITSNNKQDQKICISCLNKSNFNMKRDASHHVLGSNDIDYDIYLMMTSKLLMMSHSTFSFIPAILHKNFVYSYSEWIHYFDLLGTNESHKIQLFQPNEERMV